MLCFLFPNNHCCWRSTSATTIRVLYGFLFRLFRVAPNSISCSIWAKLVLIYWSCFWTAFLFLFREYRLYFATTKEEIIARLPSVIGFLWNFPFIFLYVYRGCLGFFRCEVWLGLIVLSRSDSGRSAGAQVASLMNFPRLGDSFVASESFFFGFACGDFAHFLHHSFVHFIN